MKCCTVLVSCECCKVYRAGMQTDDRGQRTDRMLCLVLSRSVAVGSQWWALWPRCFVSKSRSVIGTPVVTSRTIVSDLHCAQSIVRPKRQQIEKACREILGFNWWSGVAYSRRAGGRAKPITDDCVYAACSVR